MVEFPKMLYRPRAAPNQEIAGLKLDTLTVECQSDETKAVGQGWYATLAEATEQVRKLEKRIANGQKMREAVVHPATRTAGAVVLALLIAFLTNWLGWN
jgi:hypothetical protein